MKKITVYSEEFKFKLVQEYLNSDSGYKAICAKHNMSDTKNLRTWVRLYLVAEKEAQRLADSTTKKNFASKDEEIQYLNAEVAYLKKLYCSLHGKEWGAE
jgi:transposase-like protein